MGIRGKYRELGMTMGSRGQGRGKQKLASTRPVAMPTGSTHTPCFGIIYLLLDY